MYLQGCNGHSRSNLNTPQIFCQWLAQDYPSFYLLFPTVRCGSSLITFHLLYILPSNTSQYNQVAEKEIKEGFQWWAAEILVIAG